MFNILLSSKSSDITDIDTQIRLPYPEEENTPSKSYPEHFDKEDWTSKPMLNRDMKELSMISFDSFMLCRPNKKFVIFLIS